LAEVLVLPVERWRDMGRRGRARMERLFPSERVLAETLSTYDALLAERVPCAA
jgi:glycosyltransferase involved in cell wall biosynthesis